MPARRFPALALLACLGAAACQNPDGSTDWGSTLALGAGAGLATALVAGAAGDDDGSHDRGRRGYRGYERGGHGRGGHERGGHRGGGYGGGGHGRSW